MGHKELRGLSLRAVLINPMMTTAENSSFSNNQKFKRLLTRVMSKQLSLQKDEIEALYSEKA